MWIMMDGHLQARLNLVDKGCVRDVSAYTLCM